MDICVCRYKINNPANVNSYDEIDGNNFQLSDDDGPTREIFQASSRKETQD